MPFYGRREMIFHSALADRIKWVRSKCSRRRFWVIELDGEIAGVMRLDGNEIFYLVMADAHRRRGVATRLIAYAKKRYRSLTAKTQSTNERTQALLRREGFRFTWKDNAGPASRSHRPGRKSGQARTGAWPARGQWCASFQFCCKSQPSDGELDRVVTRTNSGEKWQQIFPGVATLTIVPEGNGPGLSLRITKKRGEAVQIVPEGTPDSTVVAVKRVNELDFYSLGLHDLARKLGVNATRLLWLIQRDRMQEDADFFKAIRIGKNTHKRYSGKCYEALRAKLTRINLNELWANRKVAASALGQGI
jgi:GNAT superfamily N-acetyltransferase